MANKEHESADKEQDEHDGPKSTTKNKHDWGAADLEKAYIKRSISQQLSVEREGWQTYPVPLINRLFHLCLLQVTDFHEDNDNAKEVSNVKLDSIISGPQATRKTVNIRREDVQLIVEELELPRIRAEKTLIEHDGDVIAATKALLGF
ncbi:unnamed protein product [Anisakis simplex]|uniref:HYPK_UBA domain-containing protein n=1 Tax=Anisakis simplex TaxID=6269 RepID=A0A0M3JTD4_ANISI|nr:unnamed protein product [Anisakis simplex]